MKVRIVTVPFREGLDGVGEEAIASALAGKRLLDVRDHFFVHGGRPYIALVRVRSNEISGIFPKWIKRWRHAVVPPICRRINTSETSVNRSDE